MAQVAVSQLNLDSSHSQPAQCADGYAKTFWAPPALPHVLAMGLVALTVSACASAPLTESGSLSTYSNLKASDGVVTRSRIYVSKDAVLAARSVRIMPTVVTNAASQTELTPKQLKLVSNAVDRALCRDLSGRFQVQAPDQPADLTVHAVITHVGKTDEVAAGLSKAVSIGGAATTLATGISVPSMRIPLGMGGLSVEAQAIGLQREQIAAMVWARGADVLTGKARVAPYGDAYNLTTEFAADFAKLLVTGVDPINGPLQPPPLPSAQEFNEFFGGKLKYAACEQFGPNPGLAEVVGAGLGLPPDWTDKGERAVASESALLAENR
jgi:hypothetical protein